MENNSFIPEVPPVYLDKAGISQSIVPFYQIREQHIAGKQPFISAMGKDNHAATAFASMLASRQEEGIDRVRPKSAHDVFEGWQLFLHAVVEYQVNPTLYWWAQWLGYSTKSLLMQCGIDTERSQALTATIELLRGMLDNAAKNGMVNPILWLHESKAFFGAIEGQAPVVHIQASVEKDPLVSRVMSELPALPEASVEYEPLDNSSLRGLVVLTRRNPAEQFAD